ncbi:methylmalonic aciduria and homocystinuria type D homolog, mitochondrial-like isoform X2 [Zootermopsis nevadensis]|uniref:methylmalonic aciduria and homocystinuria type D homolog, mitochondrial-like isoform X2 n=1 Tax=Zootermopsis nevadensis TaxID=136037 RepID=UPI000B8EE876|nr:methylmalonic aciduria and homocystinuria type D homolog, mitochondrial-like isoform X2 [Zootermopsis nevadensis]
MSVETCLSFSHVLRYDHETANNSIGTSPNWELLAPRGYRFYMPGNVGPAWHDTVTTAHLEEFQGINSDKSKKKTLEYAVECVAQICPLLLRRGVMELFSRTDIEGFDLTIVTLSQKTATDLIHAGHEVETEQEKVTKLFILAAQEICMKLRLAGYWADFVNPFSGRPYFTPFHSAAVYEVDERLHCLDYQIKDHGDCKIISSECDRSRSFIGSLFTTAPASITLLQDILQCD